MEALVSIGEAWLELKADGLKPLAKEKYEAWLVTVDGQMLSLGKFNSEANGQVAYKAEYDDLPQADYRYFVISVEQEPDAKPEADARRVIAGVIPDVTLQVVSGTPAATLAPGMTPTLAPPSTLPTTGIEGAPGWGIFSLALIIGLGLSCLITGKGKTRI